MRRLKKNIFYGLCGAFVGTLALVRIINPDVVHPVSEPEEEAGCVVADDEEWQDLVVAEDVIVKDSVVPRAVREKKTYHPVRSVYSFAQSFPDVQDVQITAARRWGVKPVRNRLEAEKRKDELVYVGASPYFCIDKGMRSSIPYLVPRASNLLQMIGRNFLDSLYVKGVPLHRIIVSSVLRTEEDVARLRKHNGNATDQSCHRFGTTVDIAYNRYSTVSNPDGPQKREVRNDTLKWVLSEVLRDIREDGKCYIKYEVKQGCFHLTVR